MVVAENHNGSSAKGTGMVRILLATAVLVALLVAGAGTASAGHPINTCADDVSTSGVAHRRQ
ncbi:MAG: hypothetical protein U5J64_00695 [Halobacteriales archaeon]|nr:hypothetical protein [Halobacteriales archaeon]